MNSLNRNLKDGDKLVMRDGKHVTLVAGGFGDMSFTSGTAICVRFLGETHTARGYDIDPVATLMNFADENGWEWDEVAKDLGKAKS